LLHSYDVVKLTATVQSTS